MRRKAHDQARKTRTPIARAELERAIAELVRAGNAECQGLVAVILERIAPVSPDGANWTVKGVRYGKANRELCDVALAGCVTEKQLKFDLSD